MLVKTICQILLCFTFTQTISAFFVDQTCDSIKEELVRHLKYSFKAARLGAEALSKHPLESDVSILAGMILGPDAKKYDEVRGEC